MTAPRRGGMFWAELGPRRGSAPALRRPVLVVSADRFNQSTIRTVTVAVMTSNLRLADAPGNVLVTAHDAGLSQDSVVNVSSMVTLDKSVLEEYLGSLSPLYLHRVDRGLRLALELP